VFGRPGRGHPRLAAHKHTHPKKAPKKQHQATTQEKEEAPKQREPALRHSRHDQLAEALDVNALGRVPPKVNPRLLEQLDRVLGVPTRRSGKGTKGARHESQRFGNVKRLHTHTHTHMSSLRSNLKLNCQQKHPSAGVCPSPSQNLQRRGWRRSPGWRRSTARKPPRLQSARAPSAPAPARSTLYARDAELDDLQQVDVAPIKASVIEGSPQSRRA
jgi:hypothetical protein